MLVVFALALWWGSNTIAHHAIHRPFFRGRAANQAFASLLSVLLGIPQALWRSRHLAHHAGRAWRFVLTPELAWQSALVVALWFSIAARAPQFFLSVYVPGYLAGLLLCQLHGHYEHAAGVTSHYGRLYNLLLFNDGYHVEHHAHPEAHWRRLPAWQDSGARASAWPAPLRWLDAFSLEGLERLVVRSRVLQALVLATHKRALRALLAELPAVERIAVVGGGLFPRTALILRELVPAARITIVDASAANLECARTFLRDSRPTRATLALEHACYRESDRGDCDLLIIPLSYDGDREAIYTRPPAPAVIVHDWIWRRRGVSRIVSIALLKRINLVLGASR